MWARASCGQVQCWAGGRQRAEETGGCELWTGAQLEVHRRMPQVRKEDIIKLESKLTKLCVGACLA